MGWISFSAEGKNLPAFRDAMREGHYVCRGQQVRNEVFYAQTRSYHWHGITVLAAAHEIRLEKLRERGVWHHLRPYRLRFGLLAGILCGLAFTYWCSAYVRTIEIHGNTAISDTQILEALAGLGVQRGTAYRDIPFTDVEQQMRLAVRDIEWITLRHTGGRLVVDLREEKKPPAMTHDRCPCNYVANVSAQITSMEVLGGHAAVKVGDAVKAGDVLISGVREDENGVTRFYHATGRVKGIYEYTLTLYQPFCEELTVHGTPQTETVLEAFGKRISLSLGFSPPQEPLSYTEERIPLILFGKETPFSKIICSFIPLEHTVMAYSSEEISALLDEKKKRFEQNFHSSDKILSCEIMQEETDLGILLKINYVFEGFVGEESEIFVK